MAKAYWAERQLVRKLAIAPAPAGLYHFDAWADVDEETGELRGHCRYFPALAIQTAEVAEYSKQVLGNYAECATHEEFMRDDWLFSGSGIYCGVLYTDPDEVDGRGIQWSAEGDSFIQAPRDRYCPDEESLKRAVSHYAAEAVKERKMEDRAKSGSVLISR